MKQIIYLLLLICCSITANAQDPALVKKAQSGDAKAQRDLAKYYLPNTKSVSAEGLKWLTKAAENGNAWAQWDLKCGYFGGWYGLDKDDDEKYVYWLKKLANNTDIDDWGRHYNILTDAQNELGRLYQEGSRGVEKKYRNFLNGKRKRHIMDIVLLHLI